MKTLKNSIFAVAIALVVATFGACSNNDDPTTPNNSTKEVAGAQAAYVIAIGQELYNMTDIELKVVTSKGTETTTKAVITEWETDELGHKYGLITSEALSFDTFPCSIEVTPTITLKEGYTEKEKYDFLFSKAIGMVAVYKDGTVQGGKIGASIQFTTGLKHENLQKYFTSKSKATKRTATLNSDKLGITVE